MISRRGHQMFYVELMIYIQNREFRIRLELDNVERIMVDFSRKESRKKWRELRCKKT